MNRPHFYMLCLTARSGDVPEIAILRETDEILKNRFQIKNGKPLDRLFEYKERVLAQLEPDGLKQLVRRYLKTSSTVNDSFEYILNDINRYSPEDLKETLENYIKLSK